VVDRMRIRSIYSAKVAAVAFPRPDSPLPLKRSSKHSEGRFPTGVNAIASARRAALT
jgi:hypothetical protein